MLPWLAIFMQPNASQLAMVIMTILLFMMAMMGAGAWWVAQTDPWLGALTSWWLLTLLWTRSALAFEFCLLWTLGAVLVAALQRLPSEDRRTAIRCVLLGVASQALLGLLQVAHLDPVWSNSDGLVVGVIGNTAYVACLLAAFVPVAPWPLALILFATILLAHAKVACVAALVGLAVRYRGWGWGWVPVGVGLAFLIAYNVDGSLFGGQFETSTRLRVTIWQFAYTQMDGVAFLIGKGPGQWAEQIPTLQIQKGILWEPVARVGHLMTWAHNEWVQTFYEGGMVAIALVLGWFWSHRAMFRGPYGGSVASMLVMSSAWFILHNANMALPMLVVIGVATAATESQTTSPPNSGPI